MKFLLFSFFDFQPSLPPNLPSLLLTQFPRWWFVHWQVSLYKNQQGHYQDAIHELEPYLSSPACCELQASLLSISPPFFQHRFTQKRIDELVCLSHTALQLHPSSLTACFVAATSFHLQGSFQSAVDLYQHVLLQNPRHSLTWSLLGQLYPPFLCSRVAF